MIPTALSKSRCVDVDKSWSLATLLLPTIESGGKLNSNLPRVLESHRSSAGQDGNAEWDLWLSCGHMFCKRCSETMLRLVNWKVPGSRN